MDGELGQLTGLQELSLGLPSFQFEDLTEMLALTNLTKLTLHQMHGARTPQLLPGELLGLPALQVGQSEACAAASSRSWSCALLLRAGN